LKIKANTTLRSFIDLSRTMTSTMVQNFTTTSNKKEENIPLQHTEEKKTLGLNSIKQSFFILTYQKKLELFIYKKYVFIFVKLFSFLEQSL